MKVLSLSRKLWRVFGLYHEQDDSYLIRILSVALNIIVTINLIGLMLLSLLYFHFYEEQNVRRIIYVYLQSILAVSVLMPYFLSAARKSLLSEFTKKLEVCVNQRMSPERVEIYERAEWKSHMVAKWPTLCYIVIYDGGFSCVNLFCLVSDLMRGQIDVSTWYNMIILW